MFYKRPVNTKSLACRKTIYGVGINDADYLTKIIVGKKEYKCPIYRKWHSMLERVYSDVFRKKHPTYSCTTLHPDWLLFSNFSKWYEQNHVEGYDLDKDIKVKGNKLYGPDTCLFVPIPINALMLDSASIRGVCPIGVDFHKGQGKYRSRVKVNGVSTYIGHFDTKEKAHEAYKLAKNEEIKRKMLEYPDFAIHLEQHLYI